MSNLKFHLFILAKPQVMYLLVEQVVSPEISEQAFFFFFFLPSKNTLQRNSYRYMEHIVLFISVLSSNYEDTILYYKFIFDGYISTLLLAKVF